MICQNCTHYSFYRMITEGPYGYAGPIPCHGCKHLFDNDNYEPKTVVVLSKKDDLREQEADHDR